MSSKRVAPRVKKLLKENPKLRSSDKELLLAFWASEGLVLTAYQKLKFMQCTPAESITRARRALREDFPGDQETEDARYERYEEEKDSYSAVSWL